MNSGTTSKSGAGRWTIAHDGESVTVYDEASAAFALYAAITRSKTDWEKAQTLDIPF